MQKSSTQKEKASAGKSKIFKADACFLHGIDHAIFV
jgi:hypothetical protein